jgi:choline dehydrogenase
VLPYFLKSEDNERGADAFHGKGGPLGVSSSARHELVDAFIEAAIKAGYPRNTDFNGASQEGFGFTQMTARNGQRSSAAKAFLHPARARSNLTVLTHAWAQRVVFKEGRANGVEFKRGDQVERVTARKEVILCGGAFNSPQLLQLSGIGPGSLLQQHKIPVLVDLPGVGENLQDHFTAAMAFRCTRNITINAMMASPLSKLSQGLQYLLFRKGLLASNGHFGTGFTRSDPALNAPDIRLGINLWTRTDVRSRGGTRNMGLDPNSSFGISVYVLHPDSVGTVRIRSADAAAIPEIRFNLFQSERDHMKAVKAARIARHILSLPPVAAYVAAESAPGPAAQRDEDIIEYFRVHGRPNNHSVGTCKMGVDDMAVVDPKLRVKDVSGLRVIDASVMPRVVAANTNAATIMIGEKGAAMVMEDARG